jgi:dTDP-4-dehydrorhamnose reductase
MSAVLVTGGSGQLATALAKAAPGTVRVVGRPAFDFDKAGTVDALFDAGVPELVINAAAWTAVDLAEKQPDAARRANTDGPGRLAQMCQRHAVKLIHISTDYVFDGSKGAPYVESDPTNPTGVYGATKLAGERAVRATLPDAVILRTSWVYAEQGRNFVRTMLDLARTRDRLRVVADQHGCPTNADDLAQAVLKVAEAMRQPDARYGGIYHAAGSGETTWHEFACAIFAAARPLGWNAPPVEPIGTADYPTPARRPADSRLDCGKLAATFGVRLPNWRPSLDRAVRAICTAASVA